MLHDGEYVICNVISRPELNGQVCAASCCSFGHNQTTTYTARLQRTGQVVKLTADKLSPLSEAPAQMLYDEEDLQRDEHPLAAESMLMIRLRRGALGGLPTSFTVRIQGLQSASGQPRNGQQGVVFRDNGSGRVGVRCADGESLSLKLTNMLISPDAVALPADCAAGAVPPYNAASRGAGDFSASDAPQPGFFVHLPAALPDSAIQWQAAGWPGVYTDRRLAGVAEAPPALVAECGSWNAAWERWLAEDSAANKGDCPYVMPLRTPVASDVTAAELFACFRWFLLATNLGRDISTTDGVALVGAHVEPPSVLAADVGTAPAFGVVVLSLCSADSRHYVQDLLSNLVVKARFRLSLRGQPLSFQCTSSCEIAREIDPAESATGGYHGGLLDPAPLEPPRKKRVSDDWMELKVCSNAPFAFARWAHRVHEKEVANGDKLLGMDLLFSDGGALVQ